MSRLGHLLRQAFLLPTFGRSDVYWERRYRYGGTSGAGSYGRLAEFKAQVLNDFQRQNNVERVIEFGCGDGNQLALSTYPTYLGLDISKTAIVRCREAFGEDPSKSFLWYDPLLSVRLSSFLSADLTLSLDVIYHLVEEEYYEKHLEDLFTTSRRFAIIYSTDEALRQSTPHVRHRQFTSTVRKRFPEFQLIKKLDNPNLDESPCRFFFFERQQYN